MGWPGPMTHRQFVTWRAWLELQWDRPDRTDHYLMQVASETIRPHLKKGAKVKPGDYRLTFSGKGKGKKKAPPQSMHENKGIWLQAVAGMQGAKYTPGPAETQAPAAGGG